MKLTYLLVALVFFYLGYIGARHNRIEGLNRSPAFEKAKLGDK